MCTNLYIYVFGMQDALLLSPCVPRIIKGERARKGSRESRRSNTIPTTTLSPSESFREVGRRISLKPAGVKTCHIMRERERKRRYAIGKKGERSFVLNALLERTRSVWLFDAAIGRIRIRLRWFRLTLDCCWRSIWFRNDFLKFYTI